MAEAKVVTIAELEQHTSKDNLWLLIHEKVYDVSSFIDEHPGGDEVMLAEAGKDATEAFEDVGHSDEARDQLKKLYIGDLDQESAQLNSSSSGGPSNAPIAQTASSMSYFVPLALLGAYFAWRFYSSGSL